MIPELESGPDVEARGMVSPRQGVTARDLAYGGLFGAAALLLPTIFHLLRLGHIFMPMYLPIVVLAILVRPRVALTTALLVPLLSGLATGMPPFYPPIAPVMAVELALMAFCISFCHGRWPRAKTWAVLVPVLLLGRAVNVLLSYSAAQVLELPAGFVAGLSLLSGWPGIILIVVVVPPLVGRLRGRAVLHG
jgi:hypothetical protein